jgi:hypothetical protein
LNALLDRIHDALSPPPPSALQAQPIRSPRIIS